MVRKDRITLICQNCGADIHILPSRLKYGKGKYCDLDCRGAATSFERRYWAKVVTGTADECWDWIAAVDSGGYGIIGLGAGKHLRATHVAYERANGPIPDGMCVLHRCDNRRCVNPSHLFLGTKLDNARDRDAKGRGNWPGKPGVNAKLTPEDVVEIRRRYAAGEMDQPRLAEAYGVCQSAVSQIILRKNWKHIA